MNAFDLPARRAQHPKRFARDLGFVQHQRVELICRLPFVRRLRDHESPLIAQSAALALATEERDHRVAMPPPVTARD